MNSLLLNQEPKEPTYNSKRVLIVDDFESITKTLVTILETLEFKKIHRAKNGREALSVLKDYNVDLIISDWNMPKMDGLELLKTIRRDKDLAHIPFVMVTGNIDQSDVMTAISEGVTGYLVKPFSHTMLINRVHKAFKAPIPQLIEEVNGPADLSRRVNTAPQPAPNSILLVDDEPNNLMVLGELLKGDYKLQACRSGKKALEICGKDTPPDLILLDIMMPEMSGLEVCEILKKNPLTEHIPIIFVSALSQTDDVLKGLALGAVDYITKPVTPEIVKARVKNHIKIVQQRMTMQQQIEAMVENTRIRDDMHRIFRHDLSNPLTAIIANLPVLEEKASHCVDELDMIRESSLMIQKMMSSQQTLMKLEENKGAIQLEPIDAHSLINKLCFGLQAKCEKSNIFIQYSVPPEHQYMGDSLLSYTMFSNLINNAVEAAPSGSSVKISSILDAESNTVRFNIHNLGEIPPSIHSTFFNKFVTNGKVTGTGIGTYSARLAAEAQNGEISFKTSYEEGTTLMIVFPLLE
ncbi:response regulator [Vibrio gallaecicus]|uniref:response regulator n=1 Tax=Vibrio gallaecicus TaxID=552386 RepID=UPI0010C9CA14|nr:response regulator [Vibrio gallaecicus]MDN3615970.1 response regulator [Vibrio gallaecicus]